MKRGGVEWEGWFGGGVRWFHTGGIFAALSETTSLAAREAMNAARRHGVIVSYDLNYRSSLWKGIGGPERAREVNRDLVARAAVLFGNEEDFSVALGFTGDGGDEHHTALPADSLTRMIDSERAEIP